MSWDNACLDQFWVKSQGNLYSTNLMLIRPRYLRRYRQIVEILADYGFGAVLAQIGMSERLNIPRRWRRRRVIPGDEMTNARRLRLAFDDLGPTFI